MQSPFFSIIIPTYNRSGFIKRAIESVIAQTYTDWELLIVDDGSTDDTAAIINQYSKSDARIRYLYQENQKVSAARNNGLANATGRYICFLDSDDEYKQNHLQVFKETIDAGFSNHFLFTKFISKEDSKEEVYEPPFQKYYQEDGGLNNVLSVFLPYSPPVQTICLPSLMKKKVAFNPKYNYTECYDFCARCASLAPPHMLNHATVYMHIHNANISVAKTAEQALKFYSMQLIEFSDMVKDEYYAHVAKTPEYSTKMQSLYTNVIKHLFKDRKYKETVATLISFIRWKPSFLFSKDFPVLVYQLFKN
ncbi:hypothetical protein CAP35_02565 [Chitinophagaceae bacterium IBVUCB1]|nr:hypothetical protein CAP35_02565 [Chitinophagaceae bacterium IBVUCB1]